MSRKLYKYLGPLLLLPIIVLGDTINLDTKLSLQFDEVPISTILNMIARQHNLNIVQSSQINEEISLKLDDVKLADALDAILSANGYNYFLTGDIIVVKALNMDVQGELATRTISLKYISPAAAVNAAGDLLSAKGKIKIVENPNTTGQSNKTAISTQIVVIDFPANIENITSLMSQIDTPQPQIAIEVKMIETNIDSEEKVGFSWPTSLGARLHGIPISTASTTSSTSNTEAMGQIQLPDGKWQWGRLSLEEVRVVLDYLDKTGNSKLISDPRITTLNNYEAEIKVTTVVPIQTINRFSEGGAVQDIVTFQDEEIGITLKVTPHISRDDEIMLNVNPSVAEIIGYSGPIDNQKPITSQRSVNTRITVKNGETAVLGGLMKENKIETEQRLFLLGSIPILGNLFKHKSTTISNTELLILITPTILPD